MSSVVISGNTSGTITLDAPAVAGTTTLTLPATSGTVLTTASTFGGTGPAFSAYAVATSSITGGTLTKILYDTKLFDTNTNYSTSTSRFTPTVAGYYWISGQVTGQSACTGLCLASIYVNGSEYKRGTYVQYAASGTKFGVEGLVYCNGSTDYVELYGQVPTTMNTFTNSSWFTWFNGAMIRSA